MRTRLAAGLATGPSVFAAPTWLAPQTLSPAGDGASDVRVISETGGGAVAAWARSTSTGMQIEYSYRPPGAPFGGVQPVSSADRRWVLRDLAANSQGAALMVAESIDPRAGIGVASRPPGGAFG